MPKRCVVFGGTGDIGGAISDQLHYAGWAIVTVSRNARPSVDRPFRHVAADVASEESVVTSVREILLEGEMDAVVYAVGFAPDIHIPLSEYKTSDWRRTFSAYVDGLFYVYKAVFPFLRSGAHFVVISSAIPSLKPAELPPIHAGHYAAAKGAADQFAKWARRDAHVKGVLFSRLAPASVRSAASAVLGIPEGFSLPLEAVAAKVVAALETRTEIDEEMHPGAAHS